MHQVTTSGFLGSDDLLLKVQETKQLGNPVVK